MLGIALSFGASAPLLTEPELALAADGATLTVLPAASRSDADSLGLSLKSAEPSSAYHTVEPGESLWHIAAQHDADVQVIKAANGIASDEVIRAGQVLRVPAVGLAGLATANTGDRLALKGSFSGGVGGDMVAVSSSPITPARLPLVGDLDNIAELDSSLEPATSLEQASLEPASLEQPLVADADELNEQLDAKRLDEAEIAAQSAPLVALNSQSKPAPDTAEADWSVSETKEVEVVSEVADTPVLVASAPATPPADPVASEPAAVVATLPLHAEEDLATLLPAAPQASDTAAPQASDTVAPQASATVAPAAAKKDVVVAALSLPPIAQTATTETNILGVYQVKPGDTLWSIASRHGITLDELLSHNHTVGSNEALGVGERLSVPTATDVAVEVATEAAAEAAEPVALASTNLATQPRSREQVIRDHLARIRESNNALSDREQINARIREARQELERSRTGAAPTEVPLEYYSPEPEAMTLSSPAVGGPLSATELALTAREGAQTVASEWTVTDVAQTVAPAEPEQIAAVLNELEPVSRQPVPVEGMSPSRELLAAAPLSADAYRVAPSLPIGQTVSPSMPMMPGASEFLPEAPALANGFIWPSRGTLTSGYGWRWGRMHRGIDIAGPVGTPIVAAAPGVVVRSGWNSGGYGNLVDIRHPDGSMTRYAHNSRLLVRQGEQVRQGQQIAEMGSTGFSTGPHLHFEIHLPSSGTVNPMAFLPGR